MKKILCMSLCLILALGLLTACGSSSTQENETGSEAVTQPSTEETKAPETTTAAESTTSEPTTSGEVVRHKDFKIVYSTYPISDETKAMLIEKLTNLKLEKGQSFDMNSLTFKETETSARNLMVSIFVSAIGANTNESGILECRLKRVELYKIDSKDDRMIFYFSYVI